MFFLKCKRRLKDERENVHQSHSEETSTDTERQQPDVEESKQHSFKKKKKKKNVQYIKTLVTYLNLEKQDVNINVM